MQNHILDYLTETVSRKPDKTAFSDGTDALSFQELSDQSRSIGTWLHEEGIYREPVVIFMEKHPKTVAAFLGAVAGGCFYVPVDAEMPAARINLILENVSAGVIVCDESTLEMAKKLPFGGKIVPYDDICHTGIDEEALGRIYDAAIDTDPVYVVFTSGSTGIPKGVTGCHRSVINYIEQLSEILGFGEDSVFGNQTPLYFDASMKEIYPALKFGVTAYLIPKSLFLFPVKLVEFLNEHRINTICWVVSALAMISAFDTFKTIRPTYLKTIAFMGEVFPIKQFNRWKDALPEADFVNLYGPTEGTGVCCYYRVREKLEPGEAMPVGRPFKNTEILLLNENNERAGRGEEGEICIRGTSLSPGYYNDPERTKAVFVRNPLNKAYPETIYRTGDIGRYNDRGELMFVSRKDYQIKHMGHRIELGEIEVNVNMLDSVKMSCCIYDQKKSRIVLCYVGGEEEKDMAVSLKEKLPRYMMPNRIIRLDQMPLTANGKIDRGALKEKVQGK